MCQPEAPGSPALQSLFAHYQLDAAYDDMFVAQAMPRPQYAALDQRLLDLPSNERRDCCRHSQRPVRLA